MGNKSSKQFVKRKSELIVYGYIRHEQYSLSVCIPNNIYCVCLEYYNNFVQEFYRYASDIVFAVAKESLSSEEPIDLIQILTMLKDICTKLLENKTQTVNVNDITLNDRIPQTPFLHLLGFKSINDKKPMQLICLIPNIQKCENAISVLNNFINQFDGKYNSLSIKQIIIPLMQNENKIIMETLIMSYVLFTDSITLLTQLRKAYENNTKQRNMLLKILTYWMRSYFQEDFSDDSKARQELITNWFSFEIIKNELNALNAKSKVAILEEKLSEFGDTYILDYTAQVVAEQATLIQKRLLNNIRARECIEQNWKSKNAHVLAPNILKMIGIFNEFTILIQVELFKQKNLKQRIKALNGFIEMGECFRSLQNYYGLCIVYSALNASAVLRLKHLWAKISKKNKNIFEEWKVIFSRNIRYLQIRQGNDSCIPHFALFLGDFVSIDERRKLGSNDTIKDENEKINFNVMLQIVDRIKHLQSYQNEYSYSHLIDDKTIQQVITFNLRKYKNLSNDEIWDMSTKSKTCDDTGSN